ncbi:hypothetical protein M1C57_11600 [Rhodococcus pyridinivorans]|nr:hypothetical protein [Rhodococcus pyridinivorans]UPW02402.1 hypothetical protein M1C57_11600 [Rhodococcus pyridinivorans]WMM72535.1 hypothetical protein RCF27_22370 [Rhodococcus pyridinivorans]
MIKTATGSQSDELIRLDRAWAPFGGVLFPHHDRLVDQRGDPGRER